MPPICNFEDPRNFAWNESFVNHVTLDQARVAAIVPKHLRLTGDGCIVQPQARQVREICIH
jgi:hypothetical protein